MLKIFTSPPDLSWEVSRLLPKSDSWHVPAVDNGPSFFLSSNGFHYSEHENFALSYERTLDSFTLIEVKSAPASSLSRSARYSSRSKTASSDTRS